MGDRLIGDRYRLLERHAVGGMATLWRARDERTGEVVALKRLHPFLVADPAARSRLIREAEALQAVDHPAIIRPREVIDDPDDPVLVMEFAAGRSLQERLAADGPIPPEEAVAIASTVADALAVAHEAGIVHRDVKPANILVDDAGAVHLVDFGIASVNEASAEALTAARTMVGTLRYTAPERLAGGAASTRSDVWALGAVLYEMLTGRPAVAGDDSAGALSAARTTPPLSDGLPPTLAAVVARAMAPEPADRYPDAGGFRDALLEAEAPVDPESSTVVVPIAPTLARSPGRDAGGWLSPVDRTAAVFFGAVGALALAVAVAWGVGQLSGGAATPSAPAVIEPTPSEGPTASDADPGATVSPDPHGGEKRGRGRGNGKGRGN